MIVQTIYVRRIQVKNIIYVISSKVIPKLSMMDLRVS